MNRALALGASLAVAAAGACDETLGATPARPGFDASAADARPHGHLGDAHAGPHDGGHEGGHDAHAGDAHEDGGGHHACDGIGLTGTAPDCLLFAHCGHGEFAVDCIDGGGSCQCATPDGGVSLVPYDPQFCDRGDGGDPAAALARGLAAAHVACGWE